MLIMDLGHRRITLAPPWDALVLLALAAGPPGLIWCIAGIWTR